MGFKTDLKVGEAYEDEVKELAQVIFQRKLRRVTPQKDPNLYKFLDIIEDKDNLDLAEDITIECKYSSKDTPNVVLEFEGYGAPSGISTSMAKYFSFNTERFHIIVLRSELIKLIINDLLHKDNYKKLKARDYDNKKILIIPISVIMQECPSAMKQLRFGTIIKEIGDNGSEPDGVSVSIETEHRKCNDDFIPEPTVEVRPKPKRNTRKSGKGASRNDRSSKKRDSKRVSKSISL